MTTHELNADQLHALLDLVGNMDLVEVDGFPFLYAAVPAHPETLDALAILGSAVEDLEDDDPAEEDDSPEEDDEDCEHDGREPENVV